MHLVVASKDFPTRLLRRWLPEIVDKGKTGLLFERGNVEDLVAKVERLYANPALCQETGRAGRIKAQAQYSHEVVYARLMEI